MVEIYRRKADEYLERAAYLKKQVLQPEGVSQGGGSAAAQKPKYEFVSEELINYIEIQMAEATAAVRRTTRRTKRCRTL